MTKNVFSVPIFFIVFRETLEAAIIVSTLLGLAEQLVEEDPHIDSSATTWDEKNDKDKEGSSSDSSNGDEEKAARHALIRKLRFQIFLGSGVGLLIALAIGAAFIAVWFTQASNLWERSENLWEGIFQLVASIMIFVMGISMLKLDRAKTKWRIKLRRAFNGKASGKGAQAGKWVFFILPFITVLREGMEAVVFVGGVSLGQPATSIPLATIVGLIAGLAAGYLIYQFASRTTLTIFMVVMTNLLLLIGAGLFSRCVGAFQRYEYNKMIGGEASEGGNGPGSFRIQGNVWHLDCCAAESKFSGQGWTIFSAIFGWNNSGSIGTILAYVFYWLAVITSLVYMKFKEGRMKFFGIESKAGTRQRLRRENAPLPAADADQGKEKQGLEGHQIETLPR
ncbi:hypothetical protein AMATHDRAFT_60938 [Amanita thiersii Skay4041]|uniref:Iron permease FTR1 n=1 Tax=Amanita thiersii Skay4041 TaxID=703135 RepID=A0A2A9NQI6_9AGAR|nr:hypothetical protein AMATHDRAFT_60938 [Amanita thiersii Skay4041]